jgi:ABC-type antimicrobial peptide transport system permease subunit
VTLWGLAARGLRFFWRSHLGVLLGAAVAAAVLAGALAVGDSVRYSLREAALARLGGVHLALHSPGRFFRAEIAEGMAAELNAPVAPVLILRGTATRMGQEGGDARVGRVQVLGVSDEFWRLGNAPPARMTTPDGGEGVALNDQLARSLGVKVGDDVLLRVDKPSLLSRDAPLSTIDDATVTLRLPVSAIVDARGFGRFSLEANQVPPHNAFLPLAVLQRAVSATGRASTLLAGRGRNAPLSAPAATQALWKRWELADAGLELRDVPGQDAVELRTERIFLDPPVGEAAIKAAPGARGVLTYFVNELRVENTGRATPYSTVAALEGSLIPPGMADDEILINRWLADDVGAKPGDRLTLAYWLVGPLRRLEEHKSMFRVRAVLPMEGSARDPGLMPPIPGLADKKDCREWEPGVPIDLQKIRDKDQAYWAAYRGTPKAFLTLRAGQRIWDNRFGNLTAVRYPGAARMEVQSQLRQAINPAAMGLFFLSVRESALLASGASMDFGQLFLGFSLFLIVAALLLTALLFALGVEQRAEETGTLLAVGFPPARVRGLLLWEGGALGLIAALLGVGLATLYTRAVIRGLSTVWSGAVGGSTLEFHARSATLAGGGLASFLLALFAVYLVARRQARAPARELLAAGSESETRLLAPSRGGRLPGLPTAWVAGATGIALAFAGGTAGAFFGAGALLLIAGIAACRALLAHWERQAAGDRLTVGTVAIRGTARRPGRSLGAVALFACGSFLVVAVGASRHDPGENAHRRASGTGGFALYGEASLPVYLDLNTPEGRDQFGLDPAPLRDSAIVALRLRDGDEASCLNLNRAQTPRLLGVRPDDLAGRGAFAFGQTAEGAESGGPWKLLDRKEADGAVPVVGDMNTVVWSLGKKLGDTLPYVDDRGRTHKLRIVGVLANSVLQGSLVLSEENFTRLFPGASGYQVFLVDAPAASAGAVSRELTRGLEDAGLSLTPAAERLAAFNTVENTYLSIFALLGGLGLILGSAGLGVVVLRNVWERRGELALLRAVGWRARALHGLVFREHALLLALGLGVGVASALVAVLPALRSPGAEVPVVSLALTLLAVLLSGLAWTWAATALALRGSLLSALRGE